MGLTLITGAPGWLGTQLVHYLVEGLPDVTAPSSPESSRRIRCLIKPGEDASILRGMSQRIELIEGDLLDGNAMETFCHDAEGATLFHCAGVVHPSRHIRELYDVNVAGTCQLLTAAQGGGVARALVISSISPIGFSYQPDHQFDETAAYNPYMNYGRSKMLMEEVVHEFQSQGKLQTVLLRATWFYGPGQPARQDTFFRMIRKGIVPIVGDGNNRRSMTYIDNLCQALLLAVHNPAANGQTYWIADSRPYRMNHIVDTVERLMEKEFGLEVTHRRIRLPFWTGEVAMYVDRLIQSRGLYQQKVHVLSEMNKTIACSIAKAEGELGYNPRIALEEGMRRSIAWCLANNRPI